MIDDEELMQMADNLELPIKDGTWELIASEIPVYPTKKRRWLPFIWFSCVLLVLATISWFLAYQSSEHKREMSQAMTQANAEGTIENSPGNAVAENKKKNSAVVNMTTDNPMSDLEEQKRSPVNSYQHAERNSSHSNDDLNSAIPSGAPFSMSPTLGSHADEVSNTDSLHFIPRPLGAQPFQSPMVDSHVTKAIRPVALRSDKIKFVQISLSAIRTRIALSPKLMQLKEGQGSEFSVSAGFLQKKWGLQLNLAYSGFSQVTSMGDAHDTTYYSVFRPNFRTNLPSEYAPRLHDTSKLYIAGTNHNKVDQKFSMLSVGLEPSYRFFKSGKLSSELSLAFNYKLLGRANVFFYDSINRVAVPFSQQDKGIVFRNLFSTGLKLSMTYQLTPAVELRLQPFYEYYHTPFIDHYYKASLRNYGLSTTLRYRFR